MTIPTIHLGDGLEVSQLGFGGMALSHVYGDVNEEQAERTLHAAIDCGITFIDTANVYGKPRPGTTGPAGTNEELVGRVLASRRDEVQLATKFGITGLSNNPETRGCGVIVSMFGSAVKSRCVAWAWTPLTSTTCTARI